MHAETVLTPDPLPTALAPLPPLAGACPPDTATRPQLSAAEAARFTPERYFARGGLRGSPDAPWQPGPISTAPADFIVGGEGGFDSVQAAVNAAIRSPRGQQRQRQVIGIRPGTYNGVVYIPADAPPLTIRGSGAHEVHLQLALDSRMRTADYIARVNPHGQFRPGDPAWAMFAACACHPDDTLIDTPAATVFWSQAADLQLSGLSIVNTLLDTVDDSTHQAVALRSDGDRTQLEGLRLISRQDTFFCNAGTRPLPHNRLGAYATDRIARVSARHCYIEGDTDFVFGRATAVFEDCHFHAVSSRHTRPAIVFAPDTLPGEALGYLVIRGRFTGDSHHQQAGRCFLGRSWDFGARAGYLPGITSNGQLVVRDSHIDPAYRKDSPWDHAATSARPYAGQCGPERNLDDPAFNRLWEYNNRGPGSGRL